MKNLEYEPRTTKYSILLPIFIILSGTVLYFYRVYAGISNGFSAFVSIEFGIISPLILIFGGIIIFFIILGAQQWESKMDKLNEEERQKEMRNKLIKEFKLQESKEKKHMRFYIFVGILSLTVYVLVASGSSYWAKDILFLLVIGILILATQAVRLRKFTKNSKLQKLKFYGKSIEGNILEIKKRGKGFLRDETVRYQILAQSDKTGEKYKSLKTRFNIPLYLEEGDKILIYLDDNNPKNYFIDIESAFKFKEK